MSVLSVQKPRQSGIDFRIESAGIKNLVLRDLVGHDAKNRNERSESAKKSGTRKLQKCLAFTPQDSKCDDLSRPKSFERRR